MIPYIQKGDLTALHGRRRKVICGCVIECKVFYTFTTDDEDSDFILCAGDSKQFGFEIMEMLGLRKQNRKIKRKFETWTKEDEKVIQNFFKEDDHMGDNGKFKQGTFRALCDLLGKDRNKTRNKVLSMMNEGKILS